MDNLSFSIPLVLTFIFLAANSFIILKSDFKKLSVKMWMLLLFVVIGFVGVVISRAATGNFQWYFILPFLVYPVLNALNTLLNKNRIIGQADIDIFNGALSLLVPIFISIFTKDYSDVAEYADQAKIIAVTGILSDLLTWLLIGFVLSIVVAVIRFLAQKVCAKLNNAEDSDKRASINNSVSAAIAVENKAKSFAKDASERASEVAGQFSSDTKTREESKRKMKLRGTKIPVCLSFIPLYYATVYIAMTINATF